MHNQQNTTNKAQLTKNICPWLAAIASGVVLGLCYPKHDFAHLVWIWQMPLLAALWFSRSNRISKKTGQLRPRWRRGFALGYLSGLTFFLINVSWLFALRKTVDSTGAGLAAWFLMAAYLALYFGLFGAFAASIGRWDHTSTSTAWAEKTGLPKWLAPSLHTLRIAFLNAAVWCFIEWLRGTLLTGFGWNGLGVALQDSLPLIQAAELVGVTGLAFPIVFGNCVGLATIARFVGEIRNRSTLRPHLDFAVAVALVIAQFLFGLRCMTRERGETIAVRAVLIQLDYSIKEKWTENSAMEILRTYHQFTNWYTDNEKAEIDLVIWPETALPGRFDNPVIQDFYRVVLAEGGGDWWLLTGQEHVDAIQSGTPDAQGNAVLNDVLYNAMTAMRGSPESYQSRSKIHLVPFGEYLPFRHSFPPLEWIAGGFVPSDFTRGDSYEPIALTDPDLEIIPQICFEDTVGRIGRKFIDKTQSTTGPQMLVTVTNNGWFWDSANIPQHLANARFRTVELRRPMARCANTGISCFINEYGSFTDPDDPSGFERVIRDDDTGSPHIRGTMPATLTIPKNPPVTLYARYGDAFSVLLGLIALLAILHATRRTRL